MQNDMRDKLIKLINSIDVMKFPTENFREHLADYLIENGVILPPCKVGDVVYVPKDDGTMSESKVSRIDVTFMMDTNKKPPFDTWWLHEYNIGITSFLTREDAEKALQEVDKK